MKKYLRMSDVFDMQPIRLPSSWSYEMVAHAVHAIDIHDELVEMNKELLAALHDAATSLETIQLRSFGEDSFLDSKPEMRSYAGSRAAVAREAISKVKGASS